MTPNENDHHLLRNNETLEQWWERNGLNHKQTRIKRNETYLKQLKEAARIMDKFKGEAK